MTSADGAWRGPRRPLGGRNVPAELRAGESVWGATRTRLQFEADWQSLMASRYSESHLPTLVGFNPNGDRNTWSREAASALWWSDFRFEVMEDALAGPHEDIGRGGRFFCNRCYAEEQLGYPRDHTV